MNAFIVRTAGLVTSAGLAVALAGCQGSLKAVPPAAAQGMAPWMRPAAITKVATGLSGPVGVVLDKQGNIFLTQQGSATLLKIAPDGTKSSVGAGLKSPLGLTMDKLGNFYIGNSGSKSIVKMSHDGKTKKTLAKGFASPWALGVDPDGNVYVCDYASHSYKKISPSGKVSAFVRNFSVPQGVTVSANGVVYVSGNSNTVAKVAAGGKLVQIPNTISDPLYLTRDSSGNVYVGSFGNVWKLSSGKTTNIAKDLGGKTFDPAGMAVDGKGNVYVNDLNGGVLYKISP